MQVQQQAHSIAIGDLFYGHLQVLLHPLSLLFSLLSLSIRQVAFALHERERERDFAVDCVQWWQSMSNKEMIYYTIIIWYSIKWIIIHLLLI